MEGARTDGRKLLTGNRFAVLADGNTAEEIGAGAEAVDKKVTSTGVGAEAADKQVTSTGVGAEAAASEVEHAAVEKSTALMQLLRQQVADLQADVLTIDAVDAGLKARGSPHLIAMRTWAMAELARLDVQLGLVGQDRVSGCQSSG